MGVGIIAVAPLLLITLLAVISGNLHFQPFWAGLASVFLVERVVTVWRAGLLAVAIAALLFVEFAYDLLQQVVYVKCLVDALFKRAERWGTHVFAESGT
jgi:hypothetical protein